MYLWTWVLVGLCAAGALLALASVFFVIRPALRVRRRLDDLQHARLFISLESLELQNARLAKLASESAVLAQRGQRAVEQIAKSVNAPAYQEIGQALQSSGAEISALVHDLA
jgi:hypothetical protein